MTTSNTTHNEWMIHRELGNELYLARERSALPGLLAEDEELLAVASGNMRFFDPGILAITDRRLIHLFFSRSLRRLRVTDIGYRRIEAVDSWKSRSSGVLRLHLKEPRRTKHIPIRGGVERAAELATCVKEAVARFEHRLSRDAP